MLRVCAPKTEVNLISTCARRFYFNTQLNATHIMITHQEVAWICQEFSQRYLEVGQKKEN